MTATSSRRRHLRVKAEGMVAWRPAEEAEGGRRQSRVRDISLKGFSFVAEEEPEVETPLAFELHLKGEERPPLKGEAVVAWSVWEEGSGGGVLVGAQFSEVNSPELLALLLQAYAGDPECQGCLCAEVQHCSDAEKAHCPAYQQGKNCWEFQELECCHRPRSGCCDCPYAALAFLI